MARTTAKIYCETVATWANAEFRELSSLLGHGILECFSKHPAIVFCQKDPVVCGIISHASSLLACCLRNLTVVAPPAQGPTCLATCFGSVLCARPPWLRRSASLQAAVELAKTTFEHA